MFSPSTQKTVSNTLQENFVVFTLFVAELLVTLSRFERSLHYKSRRWPYKSEVMRVCGRPMYTITLPTLTH